MTEDQKAQRLAEWLEQPPGAEPPEGLDPEVVGAIWALRPDRAPRPRLGLDAILDDVREGPFAPPVQTRGDQTAGEVIQFPKPAAPRAAEGSAPARRTRVWWALPTLGLGLAAAAAVLIVVPAIGVLNAPSALPGGEGMQAPAVTAAAPTAAPAQPIAIPEAAAPDVATRDTGRLRDAAPKTGAPTGPPKPAELADESAGLGAGFGSGAEGGGVQGGTGQEALAKAPAVESPASTSMPAPPPAASPAAVASGAPAGVSERRAESIAEAGERSRDAVDLDAVAKDDWTDRADKKKTERPAEEDERAQAEPALDAAPVAATPAKSAEQPARQETVGAKSARGGRSKPAAPAPSAAREGAAQSNVVTAAPLDYDSGWYRRHADVATIYAAAQQKEAAGDVAGALALYTPLFADARLDVAQDAAWRAGRALRAGRDYEGALRVVDIGLHRTSANTVFRSQLFVLRADILTRLGRGDDARRATRSAMELNADR